MEAVTGFLFLVSKITVDGDCSLKSEDDCRWQESYDKPRRCVEKQRYHFADKDPYSPGFGLSSAHVQL